MNDANLVLYRFFDAGGVLLYVGKSIRVWQRFADHQRGSRFFDQAVTITLQRGFGSERELLDAEAAAIHGEQPLYNKNLLEGRPSVVSAGDECGPGVCVGLVACRRLVCSCCDRDRFDARLVDAVECFGPADAASGLGLRVDQVEGTYNRLIALVEGRLLEGATVSDVVAQTGVSVEVVCQVGRGEVRARAAEGGE